MWVTQWLESQQKVQLKLSFLSFEVLICTHLYFQNTIDPPYNTNSENKMLNVNHVLSQPSRGNKEENLILANSMQRLSARLRHCVNSQERWQIQQLMNNPNQNPRKGRTFLIHLKFRTSKGKENFIKLCNDNTPNQNNE